jgi:hypothetical protein
MNTTRSPRSGSHLKAGRPACAPLLAIALLLSATGARAQSDDFNDGNDNGWNRYDPLAGFGLRAEYSFPNGGYRIRTPYTTGQAANPGRAGTVRPEMYSDFYVSVDLVSWNDSLPQSVGILARVQTVGLQTTTG